MATRKQTLEYLNVKSKALSPKDLQAKRLKAIDEKIADATAKIDKCMNQYNRVPLEYTSNYNKLLKQRKHIEDWEI